jgi:hypothetical protein
MKPWGSFFPGVMNFAITPAMKPMRMVQRMLVSHSSFQSRWHLAPSSVFGMVTLLVLSSKANYSLRRIRTQSRAGRLERMRRRSCFSRHHSATLVVGKHETSANRAVGNRRRNVRY